MSAAACPSCVFGAATTSLLSYEIHAIRTITVDVIPHVTVYEYNGTASSKTSFERITETNTDFVGSGGNGTSQTFTNEKDITWTIQDATLTYPTTYVQYLGFEGAASTSDGSETCAEPTDASQVVLPASTSCASFIYPYDGDATGAMALPTPLLEYLAQLPIVSSQFNGDALTGCAPLTWTPPATASASTTESSSTPLYSSTSVASGSSSSAPVPQTTLSSSTSEYSSTVESSSRPGNYSLSLTYGTPVLSSSSSRTIKTHPIMTTPSFPQPTSTGKHPLTPGPSAPPPPPPATSPPPPPPPPGSSTVYGSSASAPGAPGGSASAPPVYSTPTTAPQGTISHPTAFVIEPITGPTTYTTINGRGADHTTKPNNGPGGHTTKPKTPQHPDHTTGDSSPHHTTGGGSPHHTNDNGKPNPNPGNGHQTQGNGQPVSPADNGNAGHHHTAPPVYTHDGHSVTAESNGAVVIGHQTIKPGHVVTIGSGSHKTEIALQTDHGRTRLNIGGSIYNAVSQPHVTPAPKQQVFTGVMITHGHEITAVRSGNSVFLVDGTSSMILTAGQQATFDGETISVPHRGGSIAVNGTPLPLTRADKAQATVTAGGHTFTAVDAGKSVTLKDGSSTVLVKDGKQTMFEGQTVSVVAKGTAVVVNGKTITLSSGGVSTTSTTKSTTHVGDYITGGLGGNHGGSTPSATVSPANGAASSIRPFTVLGACVFGLIVLAI